MACESALGRESSLGTVMSAEELAHIGNFVAEAVRNAVSTVVPSEMEQLKTNVNRIMSRLDELSDYLEKEPPGSSRSNRSSRPRPQPAAPKTRTWTGQLGLVAREVVRDTHGISSPAPGTLKEVSDQLFVEILNAKDPSGPLDAIRSLSGHLSVVMPDGGKLPPLEEVRSIYEVPGECPSPFQPTKDKSGGEFADVAPALPLPVRVGPSAHERCDKHASIDERGPSKDAPRSWSLQPINQAKGKRTATAASQEVQSRIIKSCIEENTLGTKSSFMPVIGWILYRSLALKCMLICFLLFAVTRSIGYAEGLPMLYLVRDLSVFFFASAGLVSSRMLRDAWLHTESLFHWATVSSCVDDWIDASRKKQRVLLWWWIVVLLLMAVIHMMIAYHAVVFRGALDVEVPHAILWIACEVSSIATFVASSALLLSASAVQSHIISALNVFVDEWSCDLCENRDFYDSVVKWNTVQALIRRAGTAIENLFATIQVWALLGLGVVAVRIISFVSQLQSSWEGLTDFKNLVDLSTTLPLFMLAILAGHLLLQCSYITEKCIILPPIANQIMTDTFDVERQYLVDYLSNSAAGIYVKGVKLDMLMVTNIAYFLCVTISAFFGIAMRLSNNSGYSG